MLQKVFVSYKTNRSPCNFWSYVMRKVGKTAVKKCAMYNYLICVRQVKPTQKEFVQGTEKYNCQVETESLRCLFGFWMCHWMPYIAYTFGTATISLFIAAAKGQFLIPLFRNHYKKGTNGLDYRETESGLGDSRLYSAMLKLLNGCYKSSSPQVNFSLIGF